VGPPDRTREQELRNALGKAQLPLATRWLVVRLIDRADHGTAVIPDRFQFARGLDDLTAWCILPRTTLRRALRCAEYHGWVTATRWSDGQGGRGHPTFYAISRGTDCPEHDCPCMKKQGQPGPVYEVETGPDWPLKQGHASQKPAGQNRVSVEGNKEGEVKEGNPFAETSTLKPEYKPGSFAEIMAATGTDPWR
jgi:hypothetical protein